MKLTGLDYVVLIVRDLERALNFYTGALGLALAHRSGDYAQLQTGSTRLALYTRGAMADILGVRLQPAEPNAVGFEIGFKVGDVDRVFAELTGRGALAVVPPTDRFWGQRTAYLRDPDGYLIEIAQDLRPN